MDSNRKFIRKKFPFPSQNVYIQSAEQILLQPMFHGQHTIIFHFDVNDIDNLTTEDIVDKMMNITELCKGKYPDVKLYISGITPRRDSLNEKVEEVNRLLKDSIHRGKLFFIDNDNLDNEELLYDNKHLEKDSGVRILVSNLKRSVLKSTTKHYDYDYNYQKIKHHSFKESKQEVSVKKDPPQSRSVDMVEVRSPEIQVSSDDPKVQSDNRDSIYEVLDQLKQMNSFVFRGPVNIVRPNFLTPPSFRPDQFFPTVNY